MIYEVKFEFFGKYLRTSVEAENEREARDMIRERLHIISVLQVKEPDWDKKNDVFNDLWNIVNRGK